MLVIAVSAAPAAHASHSANTELVHLSSTEAQANGDSLDPGISEHEPAISADGRYVAFSSEGSNLVPGDSNSRDDIFVRDRQNGTTVRVSIASAGTQANGHSSSPAITPDGRYVAFSSFASNLVLGDTNATADVFVRDRQTGTTERVSVSSSETQATFLSGTPAISGTGRFVAFYSTASNLVAGDIGFADVFVRDRQNGTTERVSLSSAEIPGNHDSVWAAISSDGRYVAFESIASNLGDANGSIEDVFVRDRTLGITEVASLGHNEDISSSDSYRPVLSGDGRYVGFLSEASNLVAGDSNGERDVFVRDRQTASTERISISSTEQNANGISGFATLSADGRFVAFASNASNLVVGDTNSSTDVFLRDRRYGTTERVSLSSGEGQGNGASTAPVITADARYIAFHSHATNLVANDTNGHWDVFLRHRDSCPSGVTETGPVSGPLHGLIPQARVATCLLAEQGL